jgi:UrcA family protein
MRSVIAGSVACVLALAIVLSPSAASAAGSFSEHDQQSVVIHYTDVDLGRPEGAAQLYQRIRSAAAQVCGPRTSPGSLWASPSFKKCFNAAVDRGVAEVHRPALTAWHQQQRAHAG